MLTPALHFKALENFIEIYIRHCDVLCDILDKNCSLSDADNQKTVDLFPIVNRYALDVICGKTRNRYFCHYGIFGNFCMDKPYIVLETVMGTHLNAQQYEDGGYGRQLQR